MERTLTGVIRAIIFDWSGTLVDDLPAVWKASNEVLRRASVEALTLDQFRAEFCLPFKDFYDRLVPHVHLDQLEEWYHHHLKQVQEPIHALPHAREFLLFCRQHHFRTFLLSSIHRNHFAEQAAATGLGQFLDRCYVEAWDKRSKIREVLADNHLHPDETLFIGDMQHDVEAAASGGVFSCAVLTGYNRLHQLRISDPDLIVEHLGELQHHLEKHQFNIEPLRPKDQFPISTVGALIENPEGRLLMIQTHKWSDLWGIPGGKIKWGETAEEALRREVLEETGLELSSIEFVMVQDCIHSKEFYRDAHFLLLNYRATTPGGSVVLNDEAQNFQWVTPAEAFLLPLNQPTLKLLEKRYGRQSQ